MTNRDRVIVGGPALRFDRSLAVVVGIDAYGGGISPLRSAVADARSVAEVLRRDHGFEIVCLFDADARRSRLIDMLYELPSRLGSNDRLLFYFAGHGVALDGNTGPAGYLVPADARRSEPDGLLPMQLVHQELTRLEVRHAFIVLDCCFAGTFRWSSLRDLVPETTKIFRERYDRYLESAAWQVLTSTAANQQALDVFADARGGGAGENSPFARAFLDGLAGAADCTGDNVITADKLTIYVRERVAGVAESAGRRQVPQLFPLDRHDGGQFVFQVPKREIELVPAPDLDESTNPYRGLSSFREDDKAVFFGRAAITQRLVDAVLARPLTVVVGPSGSGKSSLVHAGLAPVLRERKWLVLPTQRPGQEPLRALDAWTRALGATPTPGASGASWVAAIKARASAPQEGPLLVIFDQFEELVTHQVFEADRDAVLEALAAALQAESSLRLVVTVRADAEPRFDDSALRSWWTAGRFAMTAMMREELRQIIEEPAKAKVLYFKPSHLIDRLLDDVALVPAPLPLLSFALSELYRRCWARWQFNTRDRALLESDYDAMGSVAQSLTRRASELHDQLVMGDKAYATTIRNVFMRMVATVGGEVTRRRVPRDELEYDDPQENVRVDEVLQRFHEARLISLATEQSLQGSARAYAEPTHDELVRGWSHAGEWLHATAETRGLLAALESVVRSWRNHDRVAHYLWDDPRVDLLNTIRESDRFALNAEETRFVASSARRRRNKRAAAFVTLVIVIVILAVSTGIALWQRNVARQRLGTNYMEQGRAHVIGGHPMQALPYLVAARAEGVDRAELRTWFGLASRNVPLVSMFGHFAAVRAASFSTDGRWVVTAGDDARARIWDAATGMPVTQPLVHDRPVTAASFSADGSRVVTGSDDNTARVWDARTGTPVTASLQHEGPVSAAAFCADGTRVVTASDDKTARVWDARTGLPIGAALEHQGEITVASFSPDGRRVLTASRDHTARIWDVVTGVPITPAFVHRGAVNAATFNADATRVVTASDDHAARVWDATTGMLLVTVEHRQEVTAAAFSPDSDRIVTASRDHSARVWDARTGVAITGPMEHQRAVIAAAFNLHGTRVATASEDHTAQVWDSTTGAPLSAPLEHRGEVTAVAFNATGTRVVTASIDRTARVWDATTKLVTALLEHRRIVSAVAFSPDGTRVVTASLDKTARVWDATTGKPQTPPLQHRARINTAVFNANGRRVVTASDDNTAQIWDAETGERVTVPFEHRAEVTAAAFSTDGGRVVTTSADKTAGVWDAVTGKRLIVLQHRASVIAAAFSPDGRRVVTASWDNTARIWDATTGNLVTAPLQHQDGVITAAFSADGSRVLTGSWDNTARVWDAATGRAMMAPLEHRGWVGTASFSADGKRVVTASWDGTARVWDAVTGRPVTAALKHRDAVFAAIFNADGTRVATASRDNTALVWDAATGEPVTAALEHLGPVNAIAFSPDGSQIITGSGDNTARIWTLSVDNSSLGDWSLVARCSPFALVNEVLARNPAPPAVCPAPRP